MHHHPLMLLLVACIVASHIAGAFLIPRGSECCAVKKAGYEYVYQVPGTRYVFFDCANYPRLRVLEQSSVGGRWRNHGNRL